MLKIAALDGQRIVKLLTSIVLFAAVLLFLVFGLYFFKFGSMEMLLSAKKAEWGTFGDFVGGTLNPILSFLGLIALLLTIVLQSNELELTREELARTADAQEKTQAVLDEQSRTQIKQQFEGTLFSLLDQHNRLLNEISVPRGDGLSLIRGTLNSLLEIKGNIADGGDSAYFRFRQVITYLNVVREVLKFNFHNAPEGEIGPHFVGNIEEASYPTRGERFYADIIKAHLSDEAALLISIYGAYSARSDDALGYLYAIVKRYDIAQEIRLLPDSPYLDILLEVQGEYQDDFS
ncbi:hypothetical protein [Pseudomonas bharatica]|uniref:hypothetical protein n=1 Tax=Pseudomonas bharatica TaxID=2692112 RepID=UPI003B28AD21